MNEVQRRMIFAMMAEDCFMHFVPSNTAGARRAIKRLKALGFDFAPRKPRPKGRPFPAGGR